MAGIGIKDGNFHTIVTSSLDLFQHMKKGGIDLGSPKQQIHSDPVGHGKWLSDRQISQNWWDYWTDFSQQKVQFYHKRLHDVQVFYWSFETDLAKFLKFNEPTNLLYHVNNRTLYSPWCIQGDDRMLHDHCEQPGRISPVWTAWTCFLAWIYANRSCFPLLPFCSR